MNPYELFKQLSHLFEVKDHFFHPWLHRSPLSTSLLANVLKTGSVTEPEKLPVHGSLVGPVVKLRLNR